MTIRASLAAVLCVTCGAVTFAFGASTAHAATSVAITEYPLPAGGHADQIVSGPDGNLWFTSLPESGTGSIGRITPTGTVTMFSAGLGAGATPTGLAVGPDGNLWFAETDCKCIGRITPTGNITQFTAGISKSTYSITAGPDGNMWFTEWDGHVGKITPAGVVTEFPAVADGELLSIAAGPDGNLWYVGAYSGSVNRITTSGVVTSFTVGLAPGDNPSRIASGPDGNMWFSIDLKGIGRITPNGDITEYTSGLAALSEPLGVFTGPDGTVWFTDYTKNKIGRITTSGAVTEYSTGISAGAGPQEITLGPDGNLWFTESQGNRIGKAVVTSVAAAGSPTPSATRVSGDNRIATAIAVSKQDYPTSGSAGGVVLARADSYPDALAGVALASSMHAPLLLTGSTSLDPTTEAEIKRVLPAGGNVSILGGATAISDGVANALTTDGFSVRRMAGVDRDETAGAIADAIGSPTTILLVTGTGFADALAAGAAAAHLGGVVLLTDGDVLPPSSADYLSAHPDLPVYAVGGPAARAVPSATPLVGADRYATSVAVANALFSKPGAAGLADGLNYPDALAGGVQVGGMGDPMLLVAPTSLPNVVSNYLAATTPSALLVYGGPTAVADSVVAAAQHSG
ncbi:MAG TPA: cell wall-binding repeat-containing protein [Acidothermaceae bacterium]